MNKKCVEYIELLNGQKIQTSSWFLINFNSHQVNLNHGEQVAYIKAHSKLLMIKKD